jgi:hypothetical protein
LLCRRQLPKKLKVVGVKPKNYKKALAEGGGGEANAAKPKSRNSRR